MASVNGNNDGSRTARLAAADLADPASGGFEGDSDACRTLRRRLAVALATDSPVFLWGESGTGKDRAARVLHRASRPADAPFLRLGPEGGWPDDPLAAAAGGTLYLDGACLFPTALQIRLAGHLQAAETNPHDLMPRIVAADVADPRVRHRDGALHDQLYFRLYVLPVALPPLRDRLADLSALAATFLAPFGATLSPDALDLLARHDWPGNVRELVNLLKEARAMAALPDSDMPLRLTAAHVPAALASGPAIPADPFDAFAGRTLGEIERLAIEAALRRAAGSVTRAARALGVAPSTIYRKMEAWGPQPNA